MASVCKIVLALGIVAALIRIWVVMLFTTRTAYEEPRWSVGIIQLQHLAIFVIEQSHLMQARILGIFNIECA